MGKYSKRPYVEMVIPSIHDKTLTPAGSEKLVALLFVQYSPTKLGLGKDKFDWTEEHRKQFISNTYSVMDEYAPNFSSSVVHEDILFPPDLERIFGLTGGNIFHGSIGLDSIYFNRPMAKWANYKSPVEGLWRCGAGTHPGGGVMGAPGRNCAKKIIKSRVL
jgi:phytoene dehydrogenase-like protein